MQPIANYPAPAPPPSGPSSAQKALAVIAVILGAMGVIGGCCGAMSSVASDSILQFQGQVLGAEGAPGAEQQREIVAASQALVAKWMPYTIFVQLLNVVASSLLLVTGVLAFRSHPKAASLTFIACGSNALVDLSIALVGGLQQLETREVTRGMLNVPGADPSVGAGMEAGMQAAMLFGVCFLVAWLLGKLVLYGAMSMVMRRA